MAISFALILLVLVLVVVGFIVLLFALIYNKLVSLRQRVKNAWSQIDVQLKRRHDLIPNLVETAKGYMAHERQTLEAVTKARQMAVDAATLKDKLAAENMLTSTLRSLMAVAENYPQLTIRVSGYAVNFIKLDRPHQLEVIKRTFYEAM